MESFVMERIKRSDLYRILFKSFLIQGSWNFQSMLGLGFCYCLIPVLNRLYGDERERQAFLRRHIEFFNAHPYFSTWSLGAVSKLEEEAKHKKWKNHQPINLFKNRTVGVLGVIGDRLFWNGFKPAAAAMAVTIGLFSWVAIPLFLIVYNIPHLYVRIKGLNLGYRKGFDIVSNLSVRRFEKYFSLASKAGVVFTGLYFGAASLESWGGGRASFLTFITAIPVTLLLTRKGKSIAMCVSASVVLAVLWGAIFSS
ncbi:hypothetical protein GF407_13695 [candidate division KSB1 bacterium]|nr:hypothetical protein [candidate division KSB1 bacterium]